MRRQPSAIRLPSAPVMAPSASMTRASRPSRHDRQEPSGTWARTRGIRAGFARASGTAPVAAISAKNALQSKAHPAGPACPGPAGAAAAGPGWSHPGRFLSQAWPPAARGCRSRPGPPPAAPGIRPCPAGGGSSPPTTGCGWCQGSSASSGRRKQRSAAPRTAPPEYAAAPAARPPPRTRPSTARAPGGGADPVAPSPGGHGKPSGPRPAGSLPHTRRYPRGGNNPSASTKYTPARDGNSRSRRCTVRVCASTSPASPDGRYCVNSPRCPGASTPPAAVTACVIVVVAD
jgi:hypothetical protein